MLLIMTKMSLVMIMNLLAVPVSGGDDEDDGDDNDEDEDDENEDDVSDGDECDGDDEDDGNGDDEDEDDYQGGGHQRECGHLDGAKQRDEEIQPRYSCSQTH